MNTFKLIQEIENSYEKLAILHILIIIHLIKIKDNFHLTVICFILYIHFGSISMHAFYTRMKGVNYIKFVFKVKFLQNFMH